MATSRHGALAFVFVLAFLPYFVGLGAPSLWDANEPLYAQPPKEVIEGGDALAPTCNGVVYYPHPPLATWLTVPSYAVFGTTALGHRLPMALLAAATLVLTFLLGRRMGGTATGVIAMLVLAGTPRYWLFARQLPGDVALVAFLTAAYLLVLPTLQGERRRLRLWAAAVVVGLAWLAKGPVVLVLYGAVVGLTWLVARPRVRLGELAPVRSLALTLACGVPWFVIMALRYDDFIEAYFGAYTVSRVAGGFGERGPFFYLVALLGDAQPWLLLLPPALVGLRRGGRRDAAALLPWFGILVPILVFSLSAGKRNVYLLPIYPCLALAVAPLLVHALEGGHRRLVRSGGGVLAFAAFAAAGLLFALGRNEPRLAPEIYVPIGVLVLAGASLALVTWRGRAREMVALLLMAPLVLELATAVTLPALGRLRPVPALAASIRAHQDPARPEEAFVYKAKIQSLRFYLDRPTRVARTPEDLRSQMRGQERAFLLTWDKRIERLREALPDVVFTELDRGPFLIFHFGRSVLGDGETTRDLVVLEARPGAVEPGVPPPRGGCGPGSPVHGRALGQ